MLYAWQSGIRTSPTPRRGALASPPFPCSWLILVQIAWSLTRTPLTPEGHGSVQMFRQHPEREAHIGLVNLLVFRRRDQNARLAGSIFKKPLENTRNLQGLNRLWRGDFPKRVTIRRRSARRGAS